MTTTSVSARQLFVISSRLGNPRTSHTSVKMALYNELYKYFWQQRRDGMLGMTEREENARALKRMST